ncbi:MAG: type II secretion system protein GspE [Omnitrophica bacterium GWA2_50_21]|nr:MAG: type II secretion system protein GspE [Omnitrophica bacterium GWA2_50_21]
MAEKTKKSLGEQLVEKGLLQPIQLEKAEKEALKAGEPLRKVLLKLGFVSEDVLMTHLADELNIPFISLSNFIIMPEVVSLVPEVLARKYTLIPIFRVGDSISVAMADPLNIFATDELKLKTKLDIETCLAPEEEIKNAINQYYSVSDDMGKMMQSLENEIGNVAAEAAGGETEVKKLESLVEEAPVIKLVNMLFLEAARQGASDIHIEPEETFLRVRYRVDGILHEVSTIPRKLQPAVISRIKILSSMDIAERRIPQDGRIQVRIGPKQIDMRVSTVPTVYGENVVIRLLDTSQMTVRLSDLGLAPENIEIYGKLIRFPYGIILITGPTGSGKTTTLYASLNQINDVGKNIITIEDPVEYRLPMIRQIQVNNKVELTFASGLRSILRQDPDVVMVGEMRDEETARIAIQAALTGHLVFSTVHTNDAASAVTRLIDMGIEPFLITSSVIGLVAQRLIRRLCKECKAPYKASKAELETLGIKDANAEITLYNPVGCEHCRKMGFKGRIAIHEVLVPDNEVRRLTIQRASSDEIKRYAIAQGMKNLVHDGLEKAKAGLTSLEEVLRIIQD